MPKKARYVLGGIGLAIFVVLIILVCLWPTAKEALLGTAQLIGMVGIIVAWGGMSIWMLEKSGSEKKEKDGNVRKWLRVGGVVGLVGLLVLGVACYFSPEIVVGFRALGVWIGGVGVLAAIMTASILAIKE